MKQTLDPQTGLQQARHHIEHQIRNQPRSLQKTIGPSEIGTPCDHCLAAKLAGWTKNETGTPWLPFIGTAVHTALENMFNKHPERYLCEQKTMVGYIGGQEIWGSTDLVDLHTLMTIDWKIVGKTTLLKAKTGPSQTYRTQAHLYARGWTTAGIPIRHVAIAYLPRQSVTLDQAIWWNEPYQPEIADNALQRANHLHTQIRALTTCGEPTLNAWIQALPREPGCYDCARYPDQPTLDSGFFTGITTTHK